MRYHVTDFYSWEWPIVEQLRHEGKFVYTLIDVGGDDYVIRRWGVCNRFGYLVTDVDILEGIDELDGYDFENLDGEDDFTIIRPIKDVSSKVEELRKKRRYNYEIHN